MKRGEVIYQMPGSLMGGQQQQPQSREVSRTSRDQIVDAYASPIVVGMLGRAARTAQREAVKLAELRMQLSDVDDDLLSTNLQNIESAFTIASVQVVANVVSRNTKLV